MKRKDTCGHVMGISTANLQQLAIGQFGGRMGKEDLGEYAVK